MIKHGIKWWNTAPDKATPYFIKQHYIKLYNTKEWYENVLPTTDGKVGIITTLWFQYRSPYALKPKSYDDANFVTNQQILHHNNSRISVLEPYSR